MAQIGKTANSTWRNLRFILLAAVGSCFLAAAMAPPAHACSCRANYQAAYDNSDVVFRGAVIAVRVEGNQRVATISVIKTMKGNLSKTVQIWTHRSSATCGYAFQNGQRLLVGAVRGNGRYRTNLCTMYALTRR